MGLAEVLGTSQRPFCSLCATGKRIIWCCASQTGAALSAGWSLRVSVCHLQNVGHTLLIQPRAGRIGKFFQSKWLEPCSNTHTGKPDPAELPDHSRLEASACPFILLFSVCCCSLLCVLSFQIISLSFLV